MNKEGIAQVTQETASVAGLHHALDNLTPGTSTYRSYAGRLVGIENDLLQPLLHTLEIDPDLQVLRGMVFCNSPYSGGGDAAQFYLLAHWLLTQSRFRPIEDVLDQLESFLIENRAPMLEVFALWGINPTASIDLVDGITLIPLSMLPDSTPKDELSGTQIYRFPIQHGAGYNARATAALVHQFVLEPIYMPQPEYEAMSRQIRSRT